MNYAEKHGLTPELLREFLDYNPSTGKFTHKARDRKHFTTNRGYGIFNSRFAGTEAIANLGGHGYYAGTVGSVMINAHIAAWAMVHGEWPNGQIDHINGDKLDNRIENLRCVTPLENACNKSKANNKTSKYIGVGWRESRKKWRAYINVSLNKYKHLGHFDTEEEAYQARLLEQSKLSQFHENHGKRTTYVGA